jgi:acetolactate synthase I/II/III large subunit
MAMTMQVAVKQRRVFEVLADVLVEEGVRTTFGLMGDDNAPLIADLIERHGVDYVAGRHENIAVSMSEGYAWATGDLGVSIISRGPGVANSLTAASTVACGRRPVLVISGDVPLRLGGYRPDLKAFDNSLFAAVSGLRLFHTSVPSRAPEALREAIRSSRSGHPAFFCVPTDVLFGVCPDLDGGDPGIAPTPPVALPSAAELREIVELIEQAERPLIIAGRGAANDEAVETLKALAAKIGALLATTLPANSLFNDSPYNAGISGGFAIGARLDLMREADLVLAFGASLSSFTTREQTLYANARIVHVDTDPARIGLNQPAHLSVVADAGATAAHLLDAVGEDKSEKPFHDSIVLDQLTTPKHDGTDESREGEVDPRVVMAALDRLLPIDRTVVSDGGGFMGLPGIYLSVSAPSHLRLTAEFGSVGMGMGTAIGAAIARRPSTTVLVVGDGGLLMTCGDLDTVTRYELPMVVVVMNDRAYGAERHVLGRFDLSEKHVFFPDTDFAAIARGFGIEAHTITSPAELEALAANLSNERRLGPILLDCKIHPDIKWRER